MRLRHSRRVLISCGLAALCSLTACAGYTPTPSTGTVGLDTAPPTFEPEATGSPSAEPEPEPDAGTWQTKWGPLSEPDRELMKKVRLATLWEMVIAQEAMQRAGSTRVRQISKEIAAQHHTLDEQVRELAAKLKVKLPVKPTTVQQAWMSDISSKSGSSYDTTYVKWLRLAHGQIFALIGTVRGSTQNTLIRRFSEQANAAVLNHQRLLESTGLTTPESFPTPSA
jgi:predicted outer membrane protein